MDRHSAEENLQVIREVMERSARYTHFSGLSGVISGVLALIGCAATWLIYERVDPARANLYYILTWCAVLALAMAEDLLLAHLKARANGQSIWNPATYQIAFGLWMTRKYR